MERFRFAKLAPIETITATKTRRAHQGFGLYEPSDLSPKGLVHVPSLTNLNPDRSATRMEGAFIASTTYQNLRPGLRSRLTI